MVMGIKMGKNILCLRKIFKYWVGHHKHCHIDYDPESEGMIKNYANSIYIYTCKFVKE